MVQPTRLCFITGTRAEFGLLAPLIRSVGASRDMEPQIIATAAHLVRSFGHTRDEIVAQGFTIDREVDCLLANDTPAAIARSMGVGLLGLASALEDLRPDVVVLLGDRYEALSAAAAAAIMNLPIAHLHGGELTLGAVDESIRHAITKLSRLHFVAAEEYRRRVLQLGEADEFVFNVGALGLQAIDETPEMSREEVARAIGLSLDAPVFLITYHPATIHQEGERGIDALLGALTNWDRYQFVFTGVNADAGHEYVRNQIEQFVATHPQRAVMHASLGQNIYTNVMRHSALVVGNSSSGVIEAPHLRKASVNIGIRQEGRLKAPSVLTCKEEEDDIHECIERALSASFQHSLQKLEPVYRGGDVAGRIVNGIRVSLPRLTSEKTFIDRRVDRTQ